MGKFSGIKIGNKCVAFCVGDDGSQPTVSTKFEQDIYNTTNILNKCINSVNRQLELKMQASNDFTVDGITAIGPESVVSIDSNQTAIVDANLAVSMLIDTISNSSAEAETKLNMLDTVVQEVKNRGTEFQGDSSTADETLLKLSNDTNLTNIQELYYSLAYCFSLISSNKAVLSNLTARSGGKINVKINQYAKASYNILDGIIDEMDTTTSYKQKQQYKTELDKTQKAESTGTLASLGDTLEKTIKNWTDMLGNIGKAGIVAMLAIPIIIVLAIIALIFVLIFRGRNKQPQIIYQQPMMYQPPMMYQQPQQYYQQPQYRYQY